MIDEYFAGKNILVTGGSGFIGSNLIERLITLGANVTAFYHTVDFQRPLFGQMTVGSPPLAYAIERTVVGDLRDPAGLREAVSVSEPEIVFHLGALTQVTEAIGRWYDAVMINTVGTVNLLDAVNNCRPDACDIIVASTDKVYGKGYRGQHFDNEDVLDPVHPYDASKAAADMLARAYANCYSNIYLQVTRMANVYGPGDTNWKRIIPYTIRRVMEGKPVVLRSDGEHVRQYLFIDDVVDAYLDVAYKMDSSTRLINGLAWNFAPDDTMSVMDVVETIRGLMYARGVGVDAGIEILDKAKDEASYLAISDWETRKQIGWSPKVPFQQGIENTIDWMQEFLNLEYMLK